MAGIDKALKMDSLERVSPVRNFYKDTNIFVTGATGFLGHVLLAKLLRSCPEIKKIYLLMRGKKGQTAEDRYASLMNDEFFDVVKKDCPDYATKISIILGDLEKPRVGLSSEDIEILKNEVDIVFHVAATVRFHEKLRLAVNINVKSTNDLLEIAAGMARLKMFVYVSTAFSNCAGRKEIEEKFYEPPISGKKLISLVEELDDETLDRITPGLLGAFPNTYVYTKNVAESVVMEKSKSLPVTVFRPAIVISTAEEPIPGWINNIYGPTGIVTATGVGLIRTVHTNENCVANVVPCDYVVNACIVSAWDAYNERENNNGNLSNSVIEYDNEKSKKGNENTDLAQKSKIYNYSIDLAKERLTWKQFMDYNINIEPEMPFMNTVWLCGLSLNSNKYVHQLYCLFFHLIPAFLMDNFCKLVGKEPKLMSTYEKIHNLMDATAYFGTRQWEISNNNVNCMWDKLPEQDKNSFKFHLKNIDWGVYFLNHVTGIRKFIMKEKPDTISKAKQRRKKLFVLHYAFVFSMRFLMVYVGFKIFRKLYNIYS